MTLVIAPAPPGPCVDSDELFSDTALDAIVATGARVLFTYAELLAANPTALARYTGRGLGVGILTYSRKNGWTPSGATGLQDATKALDIVRSLQVPAGLTLWDDVEGPDQAADPAVIIEHIDAHAAAIEAAGDIAGDYIGWGCKLTSEEWQARPNVHRYAKAGGITRDRFLKAVEPSRGYSWIQGLPFNRNVGAGAIVDVGMTTHDQLGAAAMVVWDAAHAPAAQLFSVADLARMP